MNTTTPTIFDVATAAGVTVKAALRVVHGEPEVQAPVRTRVEQAINELGYRPYIPRADRRNQRA